MPCPWMMPRFGGRTRPRQWPCIDGQSYRGATSPWWYDADAFYELTQAAGARPVRGLVESFAGCSGAKAGKAGRRLHRPPVRIHSPGDEAETLLAAMRATPAAR